MRRVLAALAAEFLEFKALRGFLFVLRCGVIAILALSALQNDFVSRSLLSILS